jgi:hypothetical protein
VLLLLLAVLGEECLALAAAGAAAMSLTGSRQGYLGTAEIYHHHRCCLNSSSSRRQALLQQQLLLLQIQSVQRWQQQLG